MLANYFICFVGVYSQPTPLPLSVASIYGNHMVLQQAPARANIWGYVGRCNAVISLSFNGMKYTPQIFRGEW